MSPFLSIAALPSQRYVVSGANVPCWNTERVFPAPTRSSYQRTPTSLPEVTLWSTTRASWSPKLR